MFRRGRARGRVVVVRDGSAKFAPAAFRRRVRCGGRARMRLLAGVRRCGSTRVMRSSSARRPTGDVTPPLAIRPARRGAVALVVVPMPHHEALRRRRADASRLGTRRRDRHRRRRRRSRGSRRARGAMARSWRRDRWCRAMPNLHSHAFQRAIAGRTGRAGAERRLRSGRGAQAMYAFLDRIDADAFEAIAAQAYVEMLKAGYTAVAEFHYVHHDPQGKPYADPAELARRDRRRRRRDGHRADAAAGVLCARGFRRRAADRGPAAVRAHGRFVCARRRRARARSRAGRLHARSRAAQPARGDAGRACRNRRAARRAARRSTFTRPSRRAKSPSAWRGAARGRSNGCSTHARRRCALVRRPRDAHDRRRDATGSPRAARSRDSRRRPRPIWATAPSPRAPTSTRAGAFGVGSDSNTMHRSRSPSCASSNGRSVSRSQARNVLADADSAGRDRRSTRRRRAGGAQALGRPAARLPRGAVPISSCSITDDPALAAQPVDGRARRGGVRSVPRARCAT